MSVNVE